MAIFMMIVLNVIPGFVNSEMCSRLDNFPNLVPEKRLPSVYITFQAVGIMTCARHCLFRLTCLSFNYNTLTGDCELNNRSVESLSQDLAPAVDFTYMSTSNVPGKLARSCAKNSCPLNSFCDPVNDISHICVTSCDSIPVVNNGKLTSEIPNRRPQGTVLNYTCEAGFLTTDELVCRADGSWQPDICVAATSCNVIKQHRTDSVDGTYWLRLPGFNNLTLLYCYKMTTDSPKEYLTLKNKNYGNYPMISNLFCSKEMKLMYNCAGKGGEIWFSKIRVDVKTMQVNTTDFTFANYSNSLDKLEYGVAHDCYTKHPDNDIRCGVKGFFVIDLRKTGWKVKDDQQRESYGYSAMIASIERQHDNRYIELRCGGSQGGCKPSGGLFLSPFPEDS